MKKDNYIDILDGSSAAILVYDQDKHVVFANKRLNDLMENASEEFGNAKLALEDFVDSCQKYKNSSEWFMRVGVYKDSIPIPIRVQSNTTILKDIGVVTILTIIQESGIKHKISEHLMFVFGNLRVDSISETVFYKRLKIKTSKLEFKLLLVLCQNSDILLSRSDLLKTVWNKRSLHTRTLDVYVSRLNRKFQSAGVEFQVITSVHSRGYLFQGRLLME